jgi:hypothetical protein
MSFAYALKTEMVSRFLENIWTPIVWCGPGSSVGIATGYGLDGPGIEFRWGKIFRTCPDRPWGPPSLLYNGYRIFPGSEERPVHDAAPSPPSSAVVMKE